MKNGRKRNQRFPMRILHDSSLNDYALHFWQREERKNSGHPAIASLRQGKDPVQLLSEYHPYKLPRPENKLVKIASLDREDVECLLIHEYMINDDWMKSRNLRIEEGCRKLKDLAAAFLEQGYFCGNWNDTQLKCYRIWKAENIRFKGK
jgi:hypothetical protein